MDEALATLATSGAQTIVNLMATDAWQKTKSLVTRIFSHNKPELAQDVDGALEASRTKILAFDTTFTQEIQRQEIDRWEAQLRLALINDNTAAGLIRDLIEAAKTQQLIATTGPTEISLRADAKGNARIYQQGQGIQHNG
jgi:hypothetical protein